MNLIPSTDYADGRDAAKFLVRLYTDMGNKLAAKQLEVHAADLELLRQDAVAREHAIEEMDRRYLVAMQPRTEAKPATIGAAEPEPEPTPVRRAKTFAELRAIGERVAEGLRPIVKLGPGGDYVRNYAPKPRIGSKVNTLVAVAVVAIAGIWSRAQQAPPAPGTQTTLIVMVGQSNCGGQVFKKPPLELRTPPANAWMAEWAEGLTTSPWGPVQPRTDLDGRHGWGTELQLAHDLSATGGYWHIVKVWQNSSKMLDNWSPATGNLYPVLVGFVKSRRAELEAAGWNVSRVRIVMMLGPSDSTNMTRASQYETGLRLFINQTATDLGASQWVCEMAYPIAPQFDLMPIVRGAILLVASDTPGVTTFSGEGVPVRGLPDGRHYTLAGLIEMARRAFTAMFGG